MPGSLSMPGSPIDWKLYSAPSARCSSVNETLKSKLKSP